MASLRYDRGNDICDSTAMNHVSQIQALSSICAHAIVSTRSQIEHDYFDHRRFDELGIATSLPPGGKYYAEVFFLTAYSSVVLK